MGWASQSEVRMILDCYTDSYTMGYYDPVTGTLTTFSRKEEPGRARGQSSGLFDHLGEKLVLLFRLDNVLYLQVEGQRMPMADHAIEVRSVNGRQVLRVLSNSKVVLELTYDPPIIDPPLSEDPTPFVEEEHFDFGLFLANLSKDQNRQDRIYAESSTLEPAEVSAVTKN